MSKFNTTAVKAARGTGPIRSTGPDKTHEGGQGYARDLKSELFLLAVANFVGEDTFYEAAGQRDDRYRQLVRQAAIEDPAWTAALLRWLRAEANMRSASLVGAAEFVHARLAAGVGSLPAGSGRGIDRAVVDAVLQRADEPGELLAYWTATHGRAVPKPVKRGIADAVTRLYSQFSLLKYDTASKGFRFGDVIELVHPTASAPWQGALFRHALDRRHGRDNDRPGELDLLDANARLRAAAASDPDVLLDEANLRTAGMTWEDTLSLAGSRVDKAKLWTAMIPSMGYMAQLRNLRNFDEAGVPNRVARGVAARLALPDEVAKSRQLPYRFLAAYENVPSLRWADPLDQALEASLANVPKLKGRSLVLIDTSGSMTTGGFTKRSKMSPVKAAAVFGVVLAMRCDADLYGFADGVFEHKVPRGASALKEIKRFLRRVGEVGHGTMITRSVQATWKGHDRVFIISDMQTMDRGTSTAVPDHVAMYGFNLGGYRVAALKSGAPNRIELGGLTDATFRMVPLLEAGRAAAWPWM